MLERIGEIDTGAIEDLTRIKRDQDVLEDRLRLMTERREGVSEVVFERVRGDYRGRLDALRQEARPLLERARREYAKLQSLRGELLHARDDAQLEKEEVEFRNGLGEFAAGEYERRAADCSERVSAREGELAEVETLRERFLGACRSPEELEETQAEPVLVTGAPPNDAAAARAPGDQDAVITAISTEALDDPAVEEPFAPPPAPVVVESAGAAMAPIVADVEAAVTPPPVPPPHGGYDFGSTKRLDAAEISGDATALDGPSPDDDIDVADPHAGDDIHEAPTGTYDLPPVPPQASVSFEEDELSGATRILARPRFVEMENGASGREHALALGRTSIGRASDNLVHLLDEAISRHHAEVVPGPRGYLLRDLGSENGIYVNGERSPEHVLRDGDVIQIGARTLVFHGA
ncbi:MAG TPA: FHA domain-containing protein [Thermoanaerobaculia bacterium]|jgi:hypothetical protein|nr:FHA domain-containing protein [Thermoanaerobaculia bacterium]